MKNPVIFSILSQIMEVNGQNFDNISITKAVDILRNNTHLSLTIKTNIFGEQILTASFYSPTLMCPDGDPPPSALPLIQFLKSSSAG